MDFTDLHELTKISDPKKRRPIAKEEKWLNLVSLQRMMANYKDQEYLTDTIETASPTGTVTITRGVSHMGLYEDRSHALEERFYFLSDHFSNIYCK